MFRGFSSEDDLCALGFCVVNMFEDFLDCSGVNERTLGCLGVETEAEFEFCDSLFEEFGESIIDLFVDE